MASATKSAHEIRPAVLALPQPAFAALLALCFAAVALPVVLFPVAPLADYPNHLARIYTIASLDRDPLLARYYGVVWRLVPNLGFDVIMLALARLFGVFTAGKIFLLACVLMLPAGTIALHRAYHRRASLWPLVSFLFVYNQVFGYGLVNYEFSSGLALIATAIWVARRDNSGPFARGALSFVFIAAMFFVHFLGLGIYGMAIGCLELERWRQRRPAARAAAIDAAALIVPFLLIVPLTLASPTVGFAGETHWTLDAKPLAIYYLFKLSSKASAVVFAASVAGAVVWGLASGRLRVGFAGRLFAGLAAAVFLAMPFDLMSALFVDARLPSTFLFFLVALSDWHPRRAGETWRFAGALGALYAVVLTAVMTEWARYERVLDQYERSFALIAPGSRVLAAANQAAADPTDLAREVHFPALVMIWRSAMYANAFTHPAQQPLVLKEPYRAAAPYDGQILPLEELAAADHHAAGSWLAAHMPRAARPVYWQDWRDHYDYLYVMFTPENFVPPAHLTPLWQGKDFTLYKIEHGGD